MFMLPSELLYFVPDNFKARRIICVLECSYYVIGFLNLCVFCSGIIEQLQYLLICIFETCAPVIYVNS